LIEALTRELGFLTNEKKKLTSRAGRQKEGWLDMILGGEWVNDEMLCSLFFFFSRWMVWSLLTYTPYLASYVLPFCLLYFIPNNLQLPV